MSIEPASRPSALPAADRPFPALAGDPAAKADENPAAVYLAGLAAGPGRDGMRYTLDRIAALAGFPDASAVPWHEFRFQHVAAVRSAAAARLAPATANRYLSALRGVLKASWRLGQIGTEDYMRTADVPRVKGSRLPAGRALDHGELRQLFATCAADATSAGFRDGAAIALLYAAGLRRTEAVSLRLADYDRSAGAIVVLGKGNRERTVFACAGARRAVAAWIAVRGSAPGPLLCPVDKVGRVAMRAMTPQAVMMRLKRRSEQAGIAPCSPHDLRRTFVSDLLEADADIAVVQRLAGHASPHTTARYDRRGDESLRRTAVRLHVHWPATS